MANRIVVGFGLLLILSGSTAAAGKSDAAWQLLQQGGLVVFIRHSLAPGVGDPPHFTLGDCSTQRNLSEEGRRQARAIGAAFRRWGVPVENVFTSQWCRCRDTASLAFGSFEEHPSLNSFFGQPELEGVQIAAMKSLLEANRPLSGSLILVTHQVNITALTGIVPAPGEMIVARINAKGELTVYARSSGSE
ncbi:MAG: histidine phosphatase family protein [Desulfobacterales bacterium]|jgi:phosphohistidine phosphatase SixA|nr:histidine phosphatase family protein [Desulfobacterales bacterium]